MSETAVIVTKKHVGALAAEQLAYDPRIVRWGYNPALRSIRVDSRKTGILEQFIPAGEFFAHTTFRTPMENCTIDEYKEKEILIDVTAAQSEEEVRAAIGVWGYQSFLYGQTDLSLVAALNDTVLPSLQKIRAVMKELSPIPASCPGEDEYDAGVPRTICATCHLAWIRSNECLAYLEEISETGLTVREPNETGGFDERFVKPSLEMLEEIRQIVQKGLEMYVRRASEEWSAIVGELDNKLRVKLNEAEHFLRKDLHQVKPQNKEVEMVERIAKTTQGANSDVLSKLAENQMQMAQQMAATQAQTNQLMTLIAGRLSGSPEVVETAAAAAAAAAPPPPPPAQTTRDNKKGK